MRPFGIPDDGWVDATGWGSDYQQQRNVDTGTMRHRKWKSIHPGGAGGVIADGDAPWSEGPAPRSELSPEAIHEVVLREGLRRE